VKFLGFNLPAIRQRAAAYSVVPERGWYPLIRETFAGAWQRNHFPVRHETVLSNITVFRCISLISGDIAKMPFRLVQVGSDGIWKDSTSPSFSPVLAKPNSYQNRIQFIENWVNSKLAAGNAYVFKERDSRNVVVGLCVLNPRFVRPLVADNGDVYYELRKDYLSGLPEAVVTVPASEIIHDRWNCFFHPLCGLSPIWACGLAATQGISIQEHSARFFQNGANPGGVLTAPGRINDETAERIRENWQEKFTGPNTGRLAVLGDGLKYEAMSVNALNSQLIDQLKWTAEAVCSAFGVPPHKAGLHADASRITDIEALGQQYYEDCLQVHIESIELCLEEGLRIPDQYGVKFNLDSLLRMDTATMVKSIEAAVGAGVMKPNEGRWKLNMGPVEGGDTPYLQQQNYSLAALAKRDAKDDPFGTNTPKPAAPAAADTPPPAPPADGGKSDPEFWLTADMAVAATLNLEQPCA
jgi:HK97 family phage portal protein